MAVVIRQAHWRDSARATRFWLFDFRAAFPLLLLVVYLRFSTLIVAVLATLFFAALERYGFTVIVFLRAIRTWLAGPRKVVYPWWVRPH